MPLLHRKPFNPRKIPSDLSEEDSVFFCKLTKEVFTDYDEFCERIILCNSLVWSCSLTGRSNLTFQEALTSEHKIKTLLKKFPHELRVPVLYLASLCKRKSLIDMTEDVYCFVKDRYFISEHITLVDSKTEEEEPCQILKVIAPTDEELKSLPRSNHSNKSGERTYWPPGSAYKYLILLKESGEQITVSASQLVRKRAAYTKDKNRLYIKQFVHSSDGIWVLKDSVTSKYGISEVKFSEFFIGTPPDLTPPSKANSGASPKKGKQQLIQKYFKPSPDKKPISPRKNNSSGAGQAKQRRRRRTKAEMLELKQKKPSIAEAKARLRQQKKEERMKQAMQLREWNKKREDLECEDLVELPSPTPVACRIPHEQFGDALLILEFLHNFKKFIPVKDFFPLGVTLDLIERALMDDEIAGPFCDLVQLLLISILDMVDQENEELKDFNLKSAQNLVQLERGVKATQEAVRQANHALVWARLHNGSLPLSQLTMDSATLSELIRLHLLSSGAKPSDKAQKWRYQNRGGYCNYDDPAIELKLSKPELIQKLAYTSVCQLPVDEKVILVRCLINQILMYSTIRDFLDDNCETSKKCRLRIRALNSAEMKKKKQLKKQAKEGGAAVAAATPEDSEAAAQRNLRGKTIDPETLSKEELDEEMWKAVKAAQLTPLGEDRAFRKFWHFSSIPGLFVEHYDTNPGPCLPKGTPWRGEEARDNKENLATGNGPHQQVQQSPAKKLLAESNMPASDVQVSKAGGGWQGGKSRLVCWGDERICPVHSPAEASRHRWYFYGTEAEIDAVIAGLNRRGIREKHLCAVLVRYRKKIVETLPQLPMSTLSPPIDGVKGDNALSSKLAKCYEQANMSFPLGTPHEDILEQLLRESILEIENKMYAGVLGSLKVKNRNKWILAIEQKTYDRQCKSLTWGGKFNPQNNHSKIEKVVDDESESSSKEDEDETSRSSSPTLELDSIVDGVVGGMLSGVAGGRPQAVADLASAILQVEQAFDHNHIKRPLGLDVKEREKGELKMPTPALERWECAVMQATSFPQLFLHLSTLDNSIIWARSALKAYCKICRKKSNPEDMLLCDTCYKGHHIFCLKPKLTRIPSGDWHCPSCRPKVVRISPVKNRRTVVLSDDEDEEMDQDEQEESPCSGCQESGVEVVCATCDNAWHLACVNPPIRKVPRGKWFCHSCRRTSIATSPPDSQPTSRPTSPPPSRPTSRPVSPPSTPRSAAASPQPQHQSRKSATFSSGEDEGVKKSSRRKRASTREEGQKQSIAEEEEAPRKRSRRSVHNGLPLDNAALQEILTTIMHHPDAWPFLRPVQRSEAPDYHSIIKKPMDFGTIKHKLNMLDYTRNADVIDDALLLFSNCYDYNEEGTEVYNAGKKLEAMFKDLCQKHNIWATDHDS